MYYPRPRTNLKARPVAPQASFIKASVAYASSKFERVDSSWFRRSELDVRVGEIPEFTLAIAFAVQSVEYRVRCKRTFIGQRLNARSLAGSQSLHAPFCSETRTASEVPRCRTSPLWWTGIPVNPGIKSYKYSVWRNVPLRFFLHNAPAMTASTLTCYLTKCSKVRNALWREIIESNGTY